MNRRRSLRSTFSTCVKANAAAIHTASAGECTASPDRDHDTLFIPDPTAATTIAAAFLAFAQDSRRIIDHPLQCVWQTCNEALLGDQLTKEHALSRVQRDPHERPLSVRTTRRFVDFLGLLELGAARDKSTESSDHWKLGDDDDSKPTGGLEFARCSAGG
jgi:hypothetical protein